MKEIKFVEGQFVCKNEYAQKNSMLLLGKNVKIIKKNNK